MQKNLISSILGAVLVFTTVAPASAVSIRAAHRQATALLSTWSCETTQSNGVTERETDTIESMGHWLHGTARPAEAGGPFYDFYLGYVRHRWTYIQIYPARGTFFVGTSTGGPKGSLNGSAWNIILPAGEGSYRFSESARQFTIAFSGLTQVCTKISAPAAAPPVPSLRCQTWKTGEDAGQPFESYLSIVPLGPHWWQGVGTDAPSGGRVIYAYNIFNSGLQRIAIALNASTGSFVVATSSIAPTLDGTVWTVIYPTLEHGFAFRNVRPSNALPDAFTLVFADGYQVCSKFSP